MTGDILNDGTIAYITAGDAEVSYIDISPFDIPNNIISLNGDNYRQLILDFIAVE